MWRTETPGRKNKDREKISLFQKRREKREETESEKKGKKEPSKWLGEILKHASTPREKELVQKHDEIKKETHGLLNIFRDNLETTMEKKKSEQGIQKLSKTPTRAVKNKNNFFKFNIAGGRLWKVTNKNYYNAQNLSNNCGPTACSIAAAKLTGMSAEKLEKKFTSNRPGGMSWDSPQHWLTPLWLNVVQASSLTADQIHREINKGNVVVTSVWPSSWLTNWGHIIALVWSQKTGDWYTFVNADPNYNNIIRWYDMIDDGRLDWGGAKQYWIVSKGWSILNTSENILKHQNIA